MIAHRERPRFGLVVVLVALCGIGMRRHSPRGRCHRSPVSSVAILRDLADQQYRAGEFVLAEHTIRIAADRAPAGTREELHVVASFYRQLGESYGLGVTSRPTAVSFRHLERALQFDAILGGAFTDKLQRRRAHDLAAIGPE